MLRVLNTICMLFVLFEPFFRQQHLSRIMLFLMCVALAWAVSLRNERHKQALMSIDIPFFFVCLALLLPFCLAEFLSIEIILFSCFLFRYFVYFVYLVYCFRQPVSMAQKRFFANVGWSLRACLCVRIAGDDLAIIFVDSIAPLYFWSLEALRCNLQAAQSTSLSKVFCTWA